MIDRYTRPEMGALFTDQKKFETWLRVEIAILEALAERGEVPAEDALEGLWEEEWRHALLGAALDELRSGARKGDRSPWVFEQVVVAGRSPADVARELDGSVESVRAAKHRALKKLRTILARLETEW